MEVATTESRIMGKLAGKTILITGGANGVGASTTELFCKEGGHVVFVDRDGPSGKALETKLLAQGLKAHFIEADISKVPEAARAVAESFKLPREIFGRWSLALVESRCRMAERRR